LSSDPWSGPFTKKLNIWSDTLIQLRLVQVSAGPCSNVSVSFGDGLPPQNYTVMIGVSVNFTYNYTYGGLYVIAVTSMPLGLPNASITVNTITVNVTGPPVYAGKNRFLSRLKLNLVYLIDFYFKSLARLRKQLGDNINV
jgi:hypothetical protein